MREKFWACVKYVASAALGAFLTFWGLGCVIARSAST